MPRHGVTASATAPADGPHRAIQASRPRRHAAISTTSGLLVLHRGRFPCVRDNTISGRQALATSRHASEAKFDAQGKCGINSSHRGRLCASSGPKGGAFCQPRHPGEFAHQALYGAKCPMPLPARTPKLCAPDATAQRCGDFSVVIVNAPPRRRKTEWLEGKSLGPQGGGRFGRPPYPAMTLAMAQEGQDEAEMHGSCVEACSSP